MGRRKIIGGFKENERSWRKRMSWIKDIISPKIRKWEDFYRNRFQHDKIVRSTH